MDRMYSDKCVRVGITKHRRVSEGGGDWLSILTREWRWKFHGCGTGRHFRRIAGGSASAGEVGLPSGAMMQIASISGVGVGKVKETPTTHSHGIVPNWPWRKDVGVLHPRQGNGGVKEITYLGRSYFSEEIPASH